jgi:hypothetical protein
MPINPATLAEAKALVVRAGMGEFVPTTAAPARQTSISLIRIGQVWCAAQASSQRYGKASHCRPCYCFSALAKVGTSCARASIGFICARPWVTRMCRP